MTPRLQRLVTGRQTQRRGAQQVLPLVAGMGKQPQLKRPAGPPFQLRLPSVRSPGLTPAT